MTEVTTRVSVTGDEEQRNRWGKKGERIELVVGSVEWKPADDSVVFA